MQTTPKITRLLEDALASPRLTPSTQSSISEHYPKAETVPISVIHSALGLARCHFRHSPFFACIGL